MLVSIDWATPGRRSRPAPAALDGAGARTVRPARTTALAARGERRCQAPAPTQPPTPRTSPARV